MNWKKIDLESGYERSQNILDAYSFDRLMLEINCNISDINEETVTKQFEETLRINIHSAKEIFKDNLKNIVKQSLKERNENS